ncbi:MAG: hypothetical protein FJ279_21265 [Planctomycetes bacterium]|nr:hypothetical protein [Planctomycetota bacterium]
MRRLGDSLEFAYIRTLMPRGAAEEDGFIYLSDPFIRRLVGPQLKLTERRRILCYNHLRMIGHASLLYRTQLGKPPKSLADLTEANCAPGKFGEGKLVCPDGGAYSLAADGQTGLCSIHGHTHFLTPCIEIPVTKVSQEEASEYRAFLEDYNRYWRTFFDPIGIRVQITPQRYRLETIVLPLIDNSIYTGLAMALGGKPEPLDALPIPKRTIFSVAARVNKEPLIQQVKQQEGDVTRELLREFGIRGAAAGELNAEEFLAKGLGNQVSMHLYDAPQMFDFNLPSFLGQAMGTFQGGWRGNRELLPISLLVTSLNAPVYLAIPVQDPKVVDKFLEDLDRLFAAMARRSMRAGIFQLDQDFYHLSSTDGRATRSFGLQFGPLKLRFFYERIGNAFYIASKPFILDDLKVASAASDAGPVAHAMARMRPENWNQVLPDFRLGWAENHREACLNNLSPLSNVARAFTSKDAAQAHSQADALYGVHFFCPEDGQYVVSADGKSVTCSVHGSPAAPRQLPAPGQDTALGKLLAGLAGTTAALTFHEDGLHAVLTIDRKP